MTDFPRGRLRIFLGGFVVFVGLFLYLPIMRPPFAHQTPGPPPGYDEAVAAIEKMIAETPASVRADARPILLVHGRPTGDVFVFLHGLSNNPGQFAELARILYERGHNVFVPRMPYHGETNLMTEDWKRLTAGDMLESANGAADLARGLGRRVTVSGLSVNGTVAAWMAQNRPDLHRTVLLAPFFAPKGVPGWLAGPLHRVLLRIPNLFLWWDPMLKEKNDGPPSAYPRFPTRAIGETMLVGSRVLANARETAPACPSIVILTTASDQAVNNGITEDLVSAWKSRRPSGVSAYQFPKDEKVPHDFIDPSQPDQQTAVAYPKLIELLESPAGG